MGRIRARRRFKDQWPLPLPATRGEADSAEGRAGEGLSTAERVDSPHTLAPSGSPRALGTRPSPRKRGEVLQRASRRATCAATTERAMVPFRDYLSAFPLVAILRGLRPDAAAAI